MRLLKILGVAVVVLGVSAFAGYHLFFKLCVPDYTGTMALPGLMGQVTVKTDEHGVPHIFAENETDLFFAEGYIIARERLFQMDMTRLAGRGELSTMFGERTLEKDRFLKTLGFYRQAKKNYGVLSVEGKAILKAFSAGVNAYINTGELPREYFILGVEPGLWVPEDSIVTILLMSYSLTRSKKVDLIMNQIRQHGGEKILAKILPSYPDFAPTLVNQEKPRAMAASFIPSFEPGVGSGKVSQEMDPFPLSLDIAASNWMIFSPKMTGTGKALFAGSPDLSPTLPGLFYIVHLKGGGIDAMGGALPGVPGIGPLGFNGHLAWSAVNGRGDELDYFVEKINPENPNQYLTENGYENFERIEETLRIKDKDGIREEKMMVKISRHGPMISGVLPMAPADCAMQWSALEMSGQDFDGLIAMNRAQNFDDFKKGLSLVRTMNLNIGYADAKGNIGWQFTAAPPIRKKGDGSLPVPGWTGEYDWEGFVPVEDLPYDYNPKSGYVASFNNDPGNVDYHLTHYYLFERAIRFENIMATRGKGPVDFAELKRMQMDTLSVVAQRWVPRILAVCKATPGLAPYLTLLEDWDYEVDITSAGATVFNYFYYLMMENTLKDEVGEEMWAKGLGQEYLYYIPDLALTRMIDDPGNRLYDDQATPEVRENQADIILKSMDQTISYLVQHLGEDTAKWQWGLVHQMHFKHPLGEKLSFLNLSPIATNGSHHTINSGFWTPKHPFEMTSGGVIRMMVDFSNLEKSTIISPPGQSGHFKSPYYDSMAQIWAKGDQIPMEYTSALGLDQTLTLVPGSNDR